MRAYTVDLSAPIVGVRSCVSARHLRAFPLPSHSGLIEQIVAGLLCLLACFPNMSERLAAEHTRQGESREWWSVLYPGAGRGLIYPVIPSLFLPPTPPRSLSRLALFLWAAADRLPATH